jgi:O-antigen ligase
VVENEHVLLMMGLVALVLVLFSTRTWSRAVALLTFLLFVSGVIIGQSRAVWISFVLGGLVILVLIDRRRRLQLVGYGLSSVVIALLVGLLVFPEFYVLIVAGLADRFYSLGSAVTSDLSLVNRFEEMGAAWKYIRLNPIVGYGFGVPIEYYSLVYELSYRTSFIHNGPIGVWYRHGLIGFGLIYFYYFASLMRGVRLSRHGAGFYKVLGIAVAACFTAEALLGNSENPFATSDKTLFIGVLAGLVAAGVARMEPPSSG